jgi:cysteine desulfurase
MTALRDRFEELLRAADIGLVVNALAARRLPHTSNVSFPPQDRQALQMALDMVDVACSTGSACTSGSTEPSHVLQAMQLPPDIVNSALRFSLGAFTTPQEIDEAARRIVHVVRS